MITAATLIKPRVGREVKLHVGNLVIEPLMRIAVMAAGVIIIRALD